MQTILGSGGAIGIELANALTRYTGNIRLVSRNPKTVNPDDQLFSADLTRREEVMRAIEGSEIAYLTIGLPYDARVWQATWPPLMKNVIDACKTHNTKLVFFDNVYLYDPDYMGAMTEDTPVRPVSKKGHVRAQLVGMLQDAVEKDGLQAAIARSADFYGPSIKNASILTETVIKNLARGGKANWLGSVHFRHSFTYTPDAGKATALLGNTADAFNQVWHLPTAPSPFTGKEWIEAIAGEFGVEPRFRTVPRYMVRLLGFLMPIMKETVEMMYQYEREYIFDSSKFEKRFEIHATPYIEGIRNIIKTDYPEAHS